MFKPLPLALTALLAAGPAFAAETADIPKSQPISRYAQMLEKSPFALATPLAPPEPTMVSRDLILTQLTHSKYHVAHLSTRGAIEMVREAKAAGMRVTAEVTPHHFSLTDAAVADYDTNAKMNPPLRSAEDVAAIVQAITDGTIDAIASDHAPHHINQKMLEFDQATVQKSVPVPAFTPNMGRGAIALPQPQISAPTTLPQPPQPVVAPHPQTNGPFGWQPGSPAPNTSQPPRSESGGGYGGRRRVIPSRPTQ